MTNLEYEKILRECEKVDWHGVLVPKDLITKSVHLWSESLIHEIDKIESELSDLRGVELDRRKSYLKVLYSNLQNAPYKLNGDFYLIKKKRIEEQIKEESKNKKTTKPKTKTSKVVKTKNSDLIFGKNK